MVLRPSQSGAAFRVAFPRSKPWLYIVIHFLLVPSYLHAWRCFFWSRLAVGDAAFVGQHTQQPLASLSAGGLHQGVSPAVFLQATKPKQSDGTLTDIPESVSRNDLIRWAAEPGQYSLSPGYPVRLLSCGSNIEGQIYSKEGGHTGDLRSIRSSYVQHVESFTARRHENLRALRQQKSYKSVRMAFYQWNAEFLTPSAFEIVYPFIPGRGEQPDIDEVEAIFVTIQENNGRSKSEHRKFMRKVTGALNALSEIPSWSIVDSTFNELSNIIGTKPTAQGPAANRQAIYMFVRDGVIKQGATYRCSWTFFGREKGFVGISTAFVGIGRLLVLGIHLPTLTEGQSHFVRLLLQQAASKCIPDDYDSEGLNYFHAGVYMVGDFNSRFVSESAELVIDAMRTDPSYHDVFNLPEPPPGQSDIVQRLRYMMHYARQDKESRFAHIFWAMDSLGGSNEVEGTAGDIRTPLLNEKFSVVSTCYLAPFSFSWKKNCIPREDASPSEAADGACLSPKSNKDPSKMGFLDRLAILLPATYGKLFRDPLPQRGAFITYAAELLNLQSDHLPQLYIVESIRKVPRPRPRSEPGWKLFSLDRSRRGSLNADLFGAPE